MKRDVMLQLGSFQFTVGNSAYQTLKHSAEYHWAENAHIRNSPSLQYTGRSSEIITLDGVVYKQIATNIDFTSALQNMAKAGKPYLLVSGEGDVMGEWAISKITRTELSHNENGSPRKISFAIELKKYAD